VVKIKQDELIRLRAQMAATIIARDGGLSRDIGEGNVIQAKNAVAQADAVLAEVLLTHEPRWAKDAAPRN
jgi:hypothetical protein